MKFRKSITSISSIKKSDFYDFDLTKEQIESAKHRDHLNPLLILDNFEVMALYSEEGELRLNYFTSYYGFKEGLGEHKFRSEFDNVIRCSCGKKFPNGKQKKGRINFKKHLAEIEELRKEIK